MLEAHTACHAERSEASIPAYGKTLRGVYPRALRGVHPERSERLRVTSRLGVNPHTSPCFRASLISRSAVPFWSAWSATPGQIEPLRSRR